MIMEKKSYSTEGVIIGRRSFGEADRILTIFSKHYGKLRVVAKGVRRPTSRKRGSLEIFSYVKIALVKGRNLDVVTEAELKDSFSSFRKDLVRVQVAYHLCEVVDKLTAEHQEHRAIFEQLVYSLGKLGSVYYSQLGQFVRSFKVFLLGELGFLERGKNEPREIDVYIEDIVGSALRTRKFLKSLA